MHSGTFHFAFSNSAAGTNVTWFSTRGVHLRAFSVSDQQRAPPHRRTVVKAIPLRACVILFSGDLAVMMRVTSSTRYAWNMFLGVLRAVDASRPCIAALRHHAVVCL